MMLHSAEIRWFFPQDLPPEVLRWFSAGHSLAAQSVREDRYLLFPDCDSVGVKLRQGRLEIKALLSPARPLSLPHGVTGRLDQWVKWSFEDAQPAALEQALQHSGRWLRVSKERYLRKFSAGPGAALEAAPDRPMESGCNVELARLAVPADPGTWFTLGFEAFGRPAATVHILDETLRAFFQAHGPPPGLRLSGRESLSYPTWLATFQ